MRIEAAKQALSDLPTTGKLLISLRESAQLISTHYSTRIEGNRLTLEEAEQVIHKKQHFPERQRDEHEVLGYYKAIDELERFVRKSVSVSEGVIKKIHALVMGGGKSRLKPTDYREGQNVIKDSVTGVLVYLPPEAKDVPQLMQDLVKWIDSSSKEELPCPLRAGVAHYQFATIHPYYDGNGRTARLLTTLILHLGGYDLKGIYSLDEYYFRNLAGYYEALQVGASHNYYEGRSAADITKWVEYFCLGMAVAIEDVLRQAQKASKQGAKDQSKLLRKLNVRQREVMILFKKSETLTALEVGKLLGLKPRTSRELCRQWVEDGFLVTKDSARKSRKYVLANRFKTLINFSP